jgi:hypothetical protein
MPNKTGLIAEALDRVLTCPNVADRNLEAANVVDVLADLASAIRGAGKDVSAALRDLADAVRKREG